MIFIHEGDIIYFSIIGSWNKEASVSYVVLVVQYFAEMQG